MPSFEELHILPSIARALERRGWTSEMSEVRDIAPTAARGHNLVVVAPPVPVYAAPAVAGMLSRLQQGNPALVVAPSAQLEEWGALLNDLARDTSLRIQTARGAARAMRRLRNDSLDVIVTTLETALLLVARSALRMETLAALFLAWPETLPDEDGMMPLMQDLPREAQRIVYTAEPARVTDLVDRYARKALTPGISGSESAVSGPVRTVTTSWTGRAHTLAEVIEVLDPASLVVWTADQGYHELIRRLISGTEPTMRLVTGDAPEASTVVAFDLPRRERLAQLVEAGEVVLLVPAGTESYVGRIAGQRRPLQLPGAVDEARSAEALRRNEIRSVIEAGSAARSVLSLAPLFERYDATLVAGALYELWRGSNQAGPAPTVRPAQTAKVFVGAGKKDGVTPNDLVAVLTKELRVDRTKIGRIELRDAYSLVELPAEDAERLAEQLNGTTIRRKRVAARVDRGRPKVNRR